MQPPPAGEPPEPDLEPYFEPVSVMRRLAMWLLFLGLFGLTLWYSSRWRRGPSFIDVCEYQLSELGRVWNDWRRENDGPPPYSGPALFLWLRQSGLIERGDGSWFVCRIDSSVVAPTSPQMQARYDIIDLSSPPRDMCSYAVRDFARFPLRAHYVNEIVAICPHHWKDVVVLFESGKVALVPRETLGLQDMRPDDIGPGAEHPELRQLLFADSLQER